MSKEQLLQIVALAFEDGADTQINFHNNTKEKAAELADKYSNHFNKPCKTHSFQGANFHECIDELDNEQRFELAIFFEKE